MALSCPDRQYTAIAVDLSDGSSDARVANWSNGTYRSVPSISPMYGVLTFTRVNERGDVSSSDFELIGGDIRPRAAIALDGEPRHNRAGLLTTITTALAERDDCGRREQHCGHGHDGSDSQPQPKRRTQIAIGPAGPAARRGT